MRILNYTGLPVQLRLDFAGGEVVIQPSGKAELMAPPKEALMTTVDHIPIYFMSKGSVIHLPKPSWSNDTMYIVSEDVAKAVGHLRNDLLVMKGVQLENKMYIVDKLHAFI